MCMCVYIYIYIHTYTYTCLVQSVLHSSCLVLTFGPLVMANRKCTIQRVSRSMLNPG